MRLNFKVSGVTFDDRQKLIKELYQKGRIRKAQLVKETDNPHDPNAVKVMIGDKTIGYVPKEASEDIGEAIPYIMTTNVELMYASDHDTYFAMCTVFVPGGEA